MGVDPVEGFLGEVTVVIEEGEIKSVEKGFVAQRYAPAFYIDNRNGLLAPGFANMHTHVAMTMFRNLADDMSLKKWLEEKIWVLEKRWVSAETVRIFAKLGMAEMIRSGTTLFLDMYFFAEELLESSREVGLRGYVAETIIDFPTNRCPTPECAAEVTRELAREKGLGGVVVAAHAIYSVSKENLVMAFSLAEELGLPFHIHLSETSWEVEESKRRFGKTPYKYLRELGIKGERCLYAHCVHLCDEELPLLAEDGGFAVICPQSELKLGSGVAPLAKYLSEGVRVCVGTDGPASNNDLDMLEEARTLSLLQKGLTGDTTVLDAKRTFKLATVEGYESLGLKGGRLAPGYLADLVGYSLDNPWANPLYNPVAYLVYSAKPGDVTFVMVDGNLIYKDGKFPNLDYEALLGEVREWKRRITGES